jgi:tRNA-dihydrouridine synthase
MVQIGGYGADGYKGDRKAIAAFLRPQLQEAKRSGAKVAINTFATNIDYLLGFVKGFEEVGGDFVEFNAHTPSQIYVSRGLGYAHMAKENQPSLFEFARRLSDALSIPLIIKGRIWTPLSAGSVERIADDYGRLAQELLKCGAASMHLNIRKEDEKRYDLDVLREIKDKSEIFLIVSGYVGLTQDGRVDLEKAVFDTKAFLKAGADLVLIGQAAMNEPTIVQRLAERLGKFDAI